MTQFLCECDSTCTRTAFVLDKDFEEYPGLFTEPDTQFIVAGCKVGPSKEATVLYETSRFQVYKDKA